MTAFERKLRTGEFPIALEITAPRGPRADILLRRARLLGDLPDAVNAIERPERLSSLAASKLLIAAGLEPVWHLTSRGRSRGDLETEIEHAAASGISCVLCIRGEHDAADKSDTPRLRELIERLCEAMPRALIGATLNPHGGPRERVLANLLGKIRAGARFGQTQPVLALADLEPFAAEVKARAPATRIVAMVIPLLSVGDALRLRARLGTPLPPGLLDRLEADGEAAGWAAFRETTAALRARPQVDGVAVMTLRADPEPGMALILASILSESHGSPPAAG